MDFVKNIVNNIPQVCSVTIHHSGTSHYHFSVLRSDGVSHHRLRVTDVHVHVSYKQLACCCFRTAAVNQLH